MRIARFYQKTLFGVFALMGLIVASTSALYVYTVDRQLTGDFLKNSRAIARSIANSNIDLIVNRNYSACSPSSTSPSRSPASPMSSSWINRA